jgi:hypothetical protein
VVRLMKRLALALLLISGMAFGQQPRGTIVDFIELSTVQPIPAPASTNRIRLYRDVSTNQLRCVAKDGVNCGSAGGEGGTVSAWGDLTGNLSAQIDLANALNSKASLVHGHLDQDVPNDITVNLAAAATALAADPADCSTGQYATGINAAGTLACSQVSFAQLLGSATDAQIPDNITIGHAATADAFAADPTDCTTGQYASGIATNGDLTCSTPAGGGGGVTTASSGQVAIYTSATTVAGDADLTYNPTTNILTVGGVVTTGTGYSNFPSQADSTVTGDIWRSSTALKYHDGSSARTLLTDLSSIAVPKGGTGLTAIGDDELILGDGPDTTKRAVLPSCNNPTTSKLLYDNAAETFSCGTDQSGGGGGGSSIVGKQTSVQAGDTRTAAGDFVSTVTIPANSLAVGDVLTIDTAGVASNTSGANVTFDFSVGTAAVDFWASSQSACAAALATGTPGSDNRPWHIRLYITVVSIGASGTWEVYAEGKCPSTSSGSNPFHVAGLTAPVTIDTTVDSVITVGAFAGPGASSAATMRQLIVRKN